MAWDGTLTPPPMHNEKAKKKEMGRQCTKTNTFFHIHLLLFFVRDDTGFFDEKAIGYRHQIVILDYYTYIDQLIVISILEIPKNGGIIQISQI